MTRLGILLGGACLLALAGCGGSETSEGNGSVEAGAGAENTAAAGAGTKLAAASGDAAAAVRLQPGQWEMKVEVKNAGLPAMPAGAADVMKNITTTTETCLTEEDAGRPDVFSGNTDGSCKSENVSAEGGRVDTTMTCGGENGGKVTIRTQGSFTPTSFETTSRSEIGAEGTKMVTEARVVGRRIGECRITEDNLGKGRKAG